MCAAIAAWPLVDHGSAAWALRAAQSGFDASNPMHVTAAHLAGAPAPALQDHFTVIVLAAGKASRFFASGGSAHKLQAELGGQTVLARTLAAVQASGLACHVVHPAGEATQGMGDSIAAGVQATAHARGWLILPADLPLVQPATLRAVAQALQAGTNCAVQPVWQGHAGHPVGFDASCARALMALQGEQGAKSVLARLKQQNVLLQLPVQDAGITMDIDTVHDLHRAQRWLAQCGA